MKALSAAMQAHLDTGATTLAWCWRVSRTDGTVLGFTDHDRTLTFGGADYEPHAGFSASEVRSGTDLSVDAQDAEGVLQSGRIEEGDILAGLWDGAEVELWRVNWADTGQRALIRRGAIGEVRRGRVAFVAEVRSLAHLLGQTVGRTYQAGCDATLGDARCGVDLDSATYKGAATVAEVLSDRAVRVTGLGAYAPAWFELGRVDWTGGENNGTAGEVARHDVTAAGVFLTLVEGPSEPVNVGDTLEVRAGCDKRWETCRAKFANGDNFRGFPHIPGPDAVLRYATPDGGHDGGVL